MHDVGIVLELEENHAIVMRKDGHFTRLPRTSDMEVGTEVEWNTRVKNTVSASSDSWRRRSWTASQWRRVGTAGIAACLAIAAGVWFATNALSPTQAEAYAFVSLDINPSISIQVDNHLVVQNADGMNADGKSLMQHLVLKGKPLKTAVSLIVNSALQNHMIPVDDTILISTAPSSSGANVTLVQQQVESTVKSTIDSNPAAKSLHPTVHALGLSSTVWNAANHANLSPGKLAAYLMAAEEGIHITDVNQLTGPKLEKVLSASSADSVSQILKANNPSQVAKFIQSLQSSGLLAAATDNETNSPSVQSGPSNSKPKAGNGHGQSTGKTDGKHAQPGVTIHLGGSSLTVPVGGEHPMVQYPLSGQGDNTVNRGNQSRGNGKEGFQYGGDHGNDGDMGKTHGDGRDKQHHGPQDGSGWQDGTDINNALLSGLSAVLQDLR